LTTIAASPHTAVEPWRDARRPVAERVAALMEQMTLREKLAQLYGIWVGASGDGGDVAPHQHDLADDIDLDALLEFGLGQLTRPFGSAPVDAAVGAASLARSQRKIVEANRFGIPAIAHEECLSGFTAWGATAYPAPLSWGATFNPSLIEGMAARIARSMRSVGVHQGLAPVLDVTRDARWGRTEETIGEDPYLVGAIASAYVRGLEANGIIATLKHFVGYSASKAGRNLAPVSVGPRELADVLLLPFEMAVRESGVRSVMHAYTDIDGVPTAADETLLTGVLRDSWGFTGTVVADYFGVAFLRLLHGVAGTWGEAASAALRAGVDVELPTVKTFSDPLLEEITSGRLDELFVDRALERVLRQKIELGLLDEGWDALPDAIGDEGLDDIESVRGSVDLDTADDRALASAIAEQAIVLVSNDGSLPIAGRKRIAVIGPCADDAMTLLGCYSFPSHVGTHHPELPIGIELPSLAEAMAREFPDAQLTVTLGCTVDGDDRGGIPAAVAAARDAEVVVLALGDRAGLFGRGTSGEGCDAESLALPGRQADLLAAVLEAGTPVVLTVISGRPYFLETAPQRAAAIVQAFFPGEEGAAAIAGVLSGRVNPSGRLPVSIPAMPGAQPSTYLASPLASSTGVSNIDPSPRFGFGHGLSYTEFEWSDLLVDGRQATGPVSTPTDGSIRVSTIVRNAGKRAGTEVVQLYLHDPVASVARPVNRLIAFTRVDLEPGDSAQVEFTVPTDLACFTGRTGARVVEPGELQLRLAASSQDVRFTAVAQLVGPARIVDHTRAFHADVSITR
jgi:beta-xylosidase